MNIARILYPVEVLGPGKRIGIWVSGCNRKCQGCSNPELWEQREEYEISVENIMRMVNLITSKHDVTGFTISGGEPMDQVHDLSALLSQLRLISEDILIYTGYSLQELNNRKCEETGKILAMTAVMIDGEYIEDRNDNSLLRGSNNQRIYILNPALEEKYRTYLNNNHNQIQNFTTSDGIVSVGIHRRGFSA